MRQIDQALIDTFINSNFGLKIAHENIEFTETTPPYAELLVLPNDVTAYSLKHSDRTDGVFRVILRYPVNTGAYDAKSKADEIAAVFKIGKKISYDGLDLKIRSYRRDNGVQEDGFYKIIISFSYLAFLER